MLDIFLKILSVIGILLLVLLAVLLAVVLLVLFYPVTYRISGKKTPEELAVKARANWLFGLLRLRFAYPDPGKVTVKFLWFTLYESGQDTASDRENGEKINPETAQESPAEPEDTGHGTVGMESVGKDAGKEKDKQQRIEQEEGQQKKAEPENVEQEREEPENKDKLHSGSWISKKIAKIKYTIRSIYDKIIRIWQNISYYRELWNEADTRQLLSHVMLRLRKILKSLRPRKLKAEILFGTGAPDTTGYAFGVYGMLMPLFGPSVVVTPDFQRAVFQGSFNASGFTTLFVLLRQVLLVVTDRRLKQFLDKLKQPVGTQERNAGGEESKRPNGHKHKNRKRRK